MKMKMSLLLEKARRLKRVCEWECNLDQEVGAETCAGLALLALVERWTSSWRY
jgi:hypothetical protein